MAERLFRLDASFTNKPLSLCFLAQTERGPKEFRLAVKVSPKPVQRVRNRRLPLSEVFCAESDITSGNPGLPYCEKPSDRPTLGVSSYSDEDGWLYFVETKGGRSSGRVPQKYVLLRKGQVYCVSSRYPINTIKLYNRKRQLVSKVDHIPRTPPSQQLGLASTMSGASSSSSGRSGPTSSSSSGASSVASSLSSPANSIAAAASLASDHSYPHSSVASASSPHHLHSMSPSLSLSDPHGDHSPSSHSPHSPPEMNPSTPEHDSSPLTFHGQGQSQVQAEQAPPPHPIVGNEFPGFRAVVAAPMEDLPMDINPPQFQWAHSLDRALNQGPPMPTPGSQGDLGADFGLLSSFDPHSLTSLASAPLMMNLHPPSFLTHPSGQGQVPAPPGRLDLDLLSPAPLPPKAGDLSPSSTSSSSASPSTSPDLSIPPSPTNLFGLVSAPSSSSSTLAIAAPLPTPSTSTKPTHSSRRKKRSRPRPVYSMTPRSWNMVHHVGQFFCQIRSSSRFRDAKTVEVVFGGQAIPCQVTSRAVTFVVPPPPMPFNASHRALRVQVTLVVDSVPTWEQIFTYYWKRDASDPRSEEDDSESPDDSEGDDDNDRQDKKREERSRKRFRSSQPRVQLQLAFDSFQDLQKFHCSQLDKGVNAITQEYLVNQHQQQEPQEPHKQDKQLCLSSPISQHTHQVSPPQSQVNNQIPAHHAVVAAHRAAVAQCVRSAQQDVLNHLDPQGFALIHYAAALGMEDECKLLLSKGASVSIPASTAGWTAIDLARLRLAWAQDKMQQCENMGEQSVAQGSPDDDDATLQDALTSQVTQSARALASANRLLDLLEAAGHQELDDLECASVQESEAQQTLSPPVALLPPSTPKTPKTPPTTTHTQHQSPCQLKTDEDSKHLGRKPKQTDAFSALTTSNLQWHTLQTQLEGSSPLAHWVHQLHTVQSCKVVTEQSHKMGSSASSCLAQTALVSTSGPMSGDGDGDGGGARTASADLECEDDESESYSSSKKLVVTAPKGCWAAQFARDSKTSPISRVSSPQSRLRDFVDGLSPSFSLDDRRHAVLVGIDMDPSALDLSLSERTGSRSCERAARELASLLQTKYSFDITCLVNKEATPDAVSAAIKECAAFADTTLFYFAGHGSALEIELHGGKVRTPDIVEMLSSSPQNTLLLDSCNASLCLSSNNDDGKRGTLEAQDMLDDLQRYAVVSAAPAANSALHVCQSPRVVLSNTLCSLLNEVADGKCHQQMDLTLNKPSLASSQIQGKKVALAPSMHPPSKRRGSPLWKLLVVAFVLFLVGVGAGALLVSELSATRTEAVPASISPPEGLDDEGAAVCHSLTGLCLSTQTEVCSDLETLCLSSL